MICTQFSRLFAVCLATLLIIPWVGGEETDTKPAESKEEMKPSQRMVFAPPKRGAPKTRIGGGVRGVSYYSGYLCVLSPEETGLTLAEAPTLYWYQSSDTAVPSELTVNKGYETVLELTFKDALKAGIHKIDLSEYNVKLEPEVVYEWTIALVPDPQKGSKDVTSSAWLTRVHPDEELTGAVAASSDSERPYLFAKHGIWYEMFDALSRRIAAEPENQELRRIRADLLDQVALTPVATYDRK